MRGHDSGVLKVARLVLKIGITLAVLAAVATIIGFVMSFIAPDRMTVRWGAYPAVKGADPVARVMFIYVLVIVALVGPALRGLLQVVESAIEGDPFTRENGARLRGVGWLLLIAQTIAAVINGVMGAILTDVYNFNLTPWSGLFIALLFFVVAHIFDQGVEMRSDLEGTV